MDSAAVRFSTRFISFEGAAMKFPNIDMHRPLPLWIPVAMITFSLCGMVYLTWSMCHAL